MKKNLLLLAIITTGFFSCEQVGKSTSKIVDVETLDSVKKVKSQKTFIYTKYEYTNSIGESLIIENSVPKGGIKYTDINGEVYVYAVFWTRIMNETDNPLKLKIDFPLNSFEVPSLPGKYFKILLPPNTMTPEKESLFNYGLKDLESLLDDNLHKAASLKRTINPKESSSFYIVTLRSIEGIKGTLRTGLSIKGQNLFYRINDQEINCGNINLNNLILKK